MDGSGLPPRGEDGGYGLVKAGLADSFNQQDRTGLRDHGTAVLPDTDMRVGAGRLLHLESAFGFSGDKVLATAEPWFWITFSAGATEGHHNRDHEHPWVMCSSRTCGPTRSKA
ncbi:hypothetical protein SSP24_74540 [Streptomyces spinoverrucosus]|uniref:Uncharacterized protein n=1 Tax=Streptomyces spinoverrucosus TaxID=284043 RepID=A0A4Y3VVU7_9ACTN|nr:hypothetical protein SSP24_74540 [Streptomyces spinoverrucosus]GHB96834.1 hypothetical protein GCM10010397_81730 [Streptomyces spinoverrucosus]